MHLTDSCGIPPVAEAGTKGGRAHHIVVNLETGLVQITLKNSIYHKNTMIRDYQQSTKVTDILIPPN